MAVRIRLMRMGKIRNPQYRIVVADSRTKRDGRAIEYVGLYHPKEDPSRIEVDSARVQHWLSVGAQPSEPVITILSKTGDWQKFKGLPAPTEPLMVAPARADRRSAYEVEAKAAAGLAEPEAKPKPAKKTAKATDAKATEAKVTEATATEATVTEATATEATVTEATATEATATDAKAEPEPATTAPEAATEPTTEPTTEPSAEVEPATPAAETAPAPAEESTDAGTDAQG